MKKINNDPQKLASEKEKRKQKFKKLGEAGITKLLSKISIGEKDKLAQ